MTKLYLFLFCTCCLLACTPLNRAAILARKAEVAIQKGKSQRAINHLSRAGKLNPKMTAVYYTQAAGLLFHQGKYKEAFKLIDRIPPCEGDLRCSEMDVAQMLAWKGSVALQLGLRERAYALNAAGLEQMKCYDLQNDSLQSVLWNNRAVAHIYRQGQNTDQERENHFRKIHRRDFVRAAEYLNSSVRLDAQNCTAIYNSQVVSAILNLPDSSWQYGYLPDSIYPALSVPSFDCLPPLPPSEPTGFSFNTITKKLAEKTEIVFVLDISGSMSAEIVPPGEGAQPLSRMAVMKAACDTILYKLDTAKTKVGAITIGGSCGYTPRLDHPVGALSAAQLNASIQALPLGGGTPLDERVLAAIQLFGASKTSKKAIFLFSDGIGSCGPYRENICGLGDELNKHGIEFYAFALLLEGGGSSGRAYGLLNCIAKTTDGLLLGVDEKAKPQDATIEIDNMAVSIPLFTEQIAAGEPKPFQLETQMGTLLDSLAQRSAR